MSLALTGSAPVGTRLLRRAVGTGLVLRSDGIGTVETGESAGVGVIKAADGCARRTRGGMTAHRERREGAPGGPKP